MVSQQQYKQLTRKQADGNDAAEIRKFFHGVKNPKRKAECDLDDDFDILAEHMAEQRKQNETLALHLATQRKHHDALAEQLVKHKVRARATLQAFDKSLNIFHSSDMEKTEQIWKRKCQKQQDKHQEITGLKQRIEELQNSKKELDLQLVEHEEKLKDFRAEQTKELGDKIKELSMFGEKLKQADVDKKQMIEQLKSEKSIKQQLQDELEEKTKQLNAKNEEHRNFQAKLQQFLAANSANA